MKVRWGVLGAARIAIQKVVPAMQHGQWSEVVAVASRDAEKAARTAATLGLRKSYGSYDALLADPDIEAIYNPLPNQLHVPWTLRAAAAGKHVLCEKPIAMNAAEAETLLDARSRTGVHIQEAFMTRVNPQWIRVVNEVAAGRIGDVRSISGIFSYFNEDPANIRNQVECGGGALMDIGCYLVNTARMIFGREPRRVAGAMERDPRFGTDVLTTMTMDFEPGLATGICSTRMVPSQRVQVFGSRGRMDVEIPFNAPPDRPCRLFVDDGSTLAGPWPHAIELETCNQYTVQGDLFSRAVRGLGPLPYPLEDSVLNMRVIDAVFKAAESGRWEDIAP
jgi:predicted dehydrogenase